jgi:Ca2+-transporting ATPase
LAALGVTPAGLSTAEVAARRAVAGPNRFQAFRPTPLLRILGRQFSSILMLLLVAAAVISLASGDRLDGMAIVAVLVLNGLIGFFTEWRARRAMEGLLALEVGRARVVREDSAVDVPADELVPGDIIELDAGRAVPADARLLSSVELELAEAALTGESVAVEKDASAVVVEDAPLTDRVTMVYKATSVVVGRGRAVVVATGMATEVGRVGRLAASVGEERTPLERRLEALGRPLAMAAIVAAVLAVGAAWLRGLPVGLAFQTAIALAVAAVPEGLPAVATITLALGVRRMARRQALIRRLPSVETLGSTTVICTDKTGTLTTGTMTATTIRLADREIGLTGAEEAGAARSASAERASSAQPDGRLTEALRIGSLANRATIQSHDDRWTALGDPTEVALLVASRRAGLDPRTFRAEWPEVGEVAFSSERMFMATFHQGPEGLVACMKGTPARVLEFCSSFHSKSGPRPLTQAVREDLLDMNRELAGRGLRVLALAEGPVAGAGTAALGDLHFVAFVGMTDPPAPGVAETLSRFRTAGIRTVMITGDQPDTALAVARALELGAASEGVLDGGELDRMSDATLAATVREATVYSRVSPEAKLRLVAALQKNGEVVAMLGDGVNDAAAIRRADIGVAMGQRGADLAKEAADIVLADDRFATIGTAVEEGRVIRDNVRKAVLYLVACNVAELAAVFGAAVIGWPLPLRPLQILWLNLLTDTVPALALGLEPGEPDVMRRPPQPPQSPLLPRTELLGAIGFAALIAGSTLAAFAWGLSGGGDPGRAMALAFLTLAFAQLFHLGNARQAGHVVTIPRALANPAALGAVVVGASLQIGAAVWSPLARLLHIPDLSIQDWGLVFGLAAVPAVLGQALKHWRSLRGTVPAQAG